MFVNITHDTKAEHRRLFMSGIVFITMLALLVALSIAVYAKAFSHPTMVTIHAENAGLQLDQFGDVRRHGVLVGQVRNVGNDGNQAVIKVALNPSSAKDIPQNADIEILPTTLFGQKYINIEDPTDPSSKVMSNGDVIPSSRVTTNVELQKILADLFPLLRSIRPADLSTTLYAIANALRGRGDQIGQTMVKLDNYLTTINVHLPDAAAGPLAAGEGQQHLRDRGPGPDPHPAQRDHHRAHGHRQAGGPAHLPHRRDEPGQDLDRRVRPSTGRTSCAPGSSASRCSGLLDTYSPEFPCLLQGAARYAGRLGTIFKGGRVRQSMTFAATQRPPYAAKDRPVYADTRGPQCYGLPYPKVPLPGPVNFANGTDGETAAGGNPN